MNCRFFFFAGDFNVNYAKDEINDMITFLQEEFQQQSNIIFYQIWNNNKCSISKIP